MTQKELLEHFLVHRKVCTDTRKIESGAIFFALKGDNFNGNLFAKQALEKGCSLAVIDEDMGDDDPRLVMVEDVLSALQSLAHNYRKHFDIPCLAITGSNGKTTTKELVRDVLKKKYRVHATKGNLNNHIGVPLTLLSIPLDCEFAIIEMGANHQREIAALCEIASPNFGLITSIGKAHLEGFGGIEGVKKGKKELYDYLFSHQGKIFVNCSIPELIQMSAGMNVISYSFNENEFHLNLTEKTPALSFNWQIPGFDSGEVKTHFTGEYNLFNIAAALFVGNYFSVPPAKCIEAIAEYVPENNRSQLVKTESNLLIMDAYNANPTSLENALYGLATQEHANKMFIIGDMLELGPEGIAEHHNILKRALSLGLEGITVGPIFHSMASDYPYLSFTDNQQAAKYLREHTPKNKLILIKGSRGIRLEELVPIL